jgi:hypothetical protein
MEHHHDEPKSRGNARETEPKTDLVVHDKETHGQLGTPQGPVASP